jgi:2-keto-4-pentenoate hydratase/2-oxohepta-3-ene-1,7-dioic acid hydratase in catechol pathway
LKFLAFEWGGYERLGWLRDDETTVLAVDRESRGMPQSVMDVIRRGPYARHQITSAEDSLERFDINDIKILPPIIPWATFCVAANSSDQEEAARLKEADHPTIYLRSPRNHVPHGDALDIPLRSKTLECEGKLAVILGRGGRYIALEHALRHVFGYTIYNEGSVKEYQNHTSQFGLGKMFDLSSGFGPAIVTEDEIGDPYQQTLETRIDGEVVHSASLSAMRHRIEEVIVYISSAVTMFAGDVICMSVPVADGPKPERLVRKDERGDTTISGVGTLSNVAKPEPTEPRTVGCC